MFHQLIDNDWHSLPSNSKKIRWHEVVTYARSQLLYKGLITVDVRMGVWEITPEDRRALETAGFGDEVGCSGKIVHHHTYEGGSDERNQANSGSDQLSCHRT